MGRSHMISHRLVSIYIVAVYSLRRLFCCFGCFQIPLFYDSFTELKQFLAICHTCEFCAESPFVFSAVGG